MNRTATAAIGSLASLAVLGMAAPALAAPVAAESNGTTTSVLCGTPAQDAVYETVTVPARVEIVEHAAEFETVPAVTRSEWRWTRDLDVLAHEYELRTPRAMVEWQYDAGELHVWEKRTLVRPPSPYVPATSYWEEQEVTVTKYLFRQRINLEDLPENGNGKGKGPQDNNGVGAADKWVENPQWNAEGVPVSVGWEYTGVSESFTETRLVEVEVPAKSAIEAKYDVDKVKSATSPGPDWTRIATISGLAKQLLAEGEEPDEEGWSKSGVVLSGAAPDKVVTKFAEKAPGGGWKATGEPKVVRTVPETTDTHSATPPAGDGWRKLADSETVVTVAPATKVQTKAAWTEQKLVKAAWTEKVKVKDAVPAGPACEIDGVDEPAPVVDVPPAQVPVPPVVAIDPPVVGENPVVVTPPVVVPEQPVVETPAPEVPVAEVPVVEVPAPPIVLGEEVQAPVAPEEDTTAPAVLGVEAKAAPTQAVVKTTTEAPRRGTVAVPTSVDAGLSVTAPAPGTDWRNAAGLVALAAGMALYAVPMRRRATVR